MYGRIDFHRMLINDRDRSLAYKAALSATISEGDIVLDVGTGSGLLAFFACQAGAGHVYAIEKSEIISVARRLAKSNGFDKCITFIKGDVLDISLPEKVDVIVSELISKSVLGQNIEEVTQYCRDQFLKNDGSIIPKTVDLCIAPIEGKSYYRKLEFPDRDAFDIDFASAQELALNNPESIRCKPDNLLAAPQIAYQIDSSSVTASSSVNFEDSFTVLKNGVLHGVCAWFSSNLAADITITNYPPGLPAWDNGFFPILRPVPVMSGDVISLRLVGKQPRDSEPLWEWSTTVKSRSSPESELKVIAEYKQSNLLDVFFSHEALADSF